MLSLSNQNVKTLRLDKYSLGSHTLLIVSSQQVNLYVSLSIQSIHCDFYVEALVDFLVNVFGEDTFRRFATDFVLSRATVLLW